MEDKKKFRAKLIILLGAIWIVITLPLPWIVNITLPLPWIVNNPAVSDAQFNTVLGIIGVMSIPFIMLGIAWSLKPELTT